MSSSAKVAPEPEHPITVATNVELAGRANQLPPIAAPVPSHPVETDVSNVAMREYENHVDSDWVGHTCGSIPVPMVTGTNRLFCGGRCIPGNDFSYLVGAQVLILSSVAAFVYGIVEESRGSCLAQLAWTQGSSHATPTLWTSIRTRS
eukprot:TRINITY_DN2289_c0_g1_i1.p2 TRINITY_DN2289_c0_g1~~TRINITY_DN2289_c0_g1_i1.p2  ORF type:complete len:148 (-),score=21.54 TRINITY_DN2289_c0_g1_i1:677-1120(-)